MKYTPVALETTLPSTAVAATSTQGPASTESLVTGAPSPRVARRGRPGRTSRTRITAAKMIEGRYWLCAVGRAPPSSPVAKPIEKPPSVAGIGRLRPPSTTPARTTIVSCSAKSGVTSGFCTVEHHGDHGSERARDEHGAADHAVRAHAEQSRGLEVLRRRAHVQPDRSAREQELEQDEADDGDDDRDDRDLADVDAGDRPRLVQRAE